MAPSRSNRFATHRLTHTATVTTTTTTPTLFLILCDRSRAPQKNTAPPPHRLTPPSAHLFTILATAQALEYRRKIQHLIHSSPHPRFHIPPQREHPHLFTILAADLERRRKFSAANRRPTPLSNARPPTATSCDRSRTSQCRVQHLHFLSASIW